MSNHSDNPSNNITLTPTERLTRTALAAAVICILGPLSVPIPVSPVPLSLTHLGIYLAAYTLGRKDATAATLIYLLLGAVGLPVFSGFSGGFAKLAGPTGGYLLGFVILTFVVAAAVDRYDGKRGPVALAMLWGNLAVYATVLCDEDVRPMVREIYCNDGPGFLQEIVDTDSYRTAAAITRSFVPEESLFGLLMNGMLQHRIIKSSAKGIYQHDAMSWQVEGNHFVAGEGLSQSSQMVSRTLAEWISGMKEEQRRDFVETVFDVLASSGKDTFAEIHSDKLKNYGEIAKAVMGLDKPRRDSLMDALGALARTGRDALVGELTKLLQ